MMKRCVILLFPALLYAAPVLAETYSWVDDKGTVNFSDDISQVPKKYRKKVRPRGDMGAGTAATSAAPSESAGQVSPADSGGKSQEGKPDKKEALYGSRSGDSWKDEFSSLKSEIRQTDERLAELNGQLGDTGKMTRNEYLGINGAIKSLQYRRDELGKKLDALTAAANKAGVPAEFR
jgi:hypothetical protein